MKIYKGLTYKSKTTRSCIDSSFQIKLLQRITFLKKPCIPFIKSTKLGLGATGEHGIEASHQSLAKIEKRASGIMSATQKSTFLLKSSLLQNYPKLRYAKKSKSAKPSKHESWFTQPYWLQLHKHCIPAFFYLYISLIISFHDLSLLLIFSKTNYIFVIYQRC